MKQVLQSLVGANRITFLWAFQFNFVIVVKKVVADMQLKETYVYRSLLSVAVQMYFYLRLCITVAANSFLIKSDKNESSQFVAKYQYIDGCANAIA